MILPLNTLKTAVIFLWNNSQTRLMIAHFRDNPILWDKQLKDKVIPEGLDWGMQMSVAS